MARPSALQQGAPRSRHWEAAALVFALASLLYLPALTFQFTNWDDNVLVTDNPLLQALRPNLVIEVFTSFQAHDYWPLNLLSLALDRLLWGFNPAGYHLTNLLLHALNAALVYLLLVRLAGPGLPALFGALWFGLHPLQVESVAWVAERKNVLSLALFLGAMLAYLRTVTLSGATRRGLPLGAYLASLGLFAGALLSKTSTVVLPAVLVALHLCLRRRHLILTLPHFLLAAVGSLLTLLSKAEFVQAYAAGSFAGALLTMPTLIAAYLAKLFFPVQLNTLYDFTPVGGLAAPKFWTALVLLLGLALLTPTLWRRQRDAVFGAAWFLLGLTPVLQFVPFPTLFAERFVYLPSVGLAIIGCSLAARGTALRRTAKRAAAALLTVALILLALLTTLRLPVWRTSQTLWRDTVAKSPQLPVAHNNLSNASRKAGAWDRAVAAALVALSGDPRYAKAQHNLGMAYLARGRPRGAARHLHAAQRLAPETPSFSEALGLSFLTLRQPTKAAAAALESLALAPGSPQAHLILGWAYANLDEAERALRPLARALAARPDLPDGHRLRGFAFLRLYQPTKAAAEILTAIRLAPAQEESWRYLGDTFKSAGQLRRAVTAYRTALRQDARSARGWNNLGDALLALGHSDAAALAFLHSLSADPAYAKAWNNLGSVATQRQRAPRAVSALRQALLLAPTYAHAHSNLGVAFNALGRRDAALAQFQHALVLQPGHPQSMFNIAALLQRLGRTQLALRWYDQVRRSPQGPRSLARRAEEESARLRAASTTSSPAP